jgi:acetyl-CoA acetyltransferase
MSAAVLTALVRRTGVDPELIDDVLWGCVNQVGDQAAQIGRYAVLAAVGRRPFPASRSTGRVGRARARSTSRRAC